MVLAFLVAIISTPVPDTSLTSTSPMRTGAATEMSLRASMTSNIFSFGISLAVLQETIEMSEPVTRTVEVTIRVGAVISFLAYISPLLHVFPSTEIMILFSNVIFTLQPKGQPIQVSSCFSIALSLLYSDRDFLKICYFVKFSFVKYSLFHFTWCHYRAFSPAYKCIIEICCNTAVFIYCSDTETDGKLII